MSKSAGAVTVTFKALTDGLDKGVDKAEKKVGGFASKASQLGGDMVVVGAGMAAVGGGITGVMGLGVKAFASFDDSMLAVQAKAEETGKSFDDLRNQAKKLGSETDFSAKVAADAMAFLAQSGWDTSQIYENMPHILDLASATTTDLASTANISSNIMAGFGLDVDKDMQRVADVLTKTANTTNTDLHSLGETFKYAAPLAQMVGYEFEDLSAMMGIMGDAGLTGSMIGTGLNDAIGRLSDTTGPASKALGELGISATDSSGQLRPLDEIMGDLAGTGAGVEDMIAIFGKTAGPKLANLLSKGEDGIKELSNDLRDAGGVAEETSELMRSGVGGGIREMNSALEGASIEIGEALAPVVIALIPHIVGLTQSLIGFVQENPELIQMVGIVGGVLLGLGTIIFTVGGAIIGVIGFVTKLVSAWAILKGAAVVVGAFIAGITAPVWAVIGAIVAVIAIGVLLWQNWDWISQKASDAWNWISSKTNEGFNNVKSFIGAGWDWVSNKFTEGVNWVKTTTSNGWNAITGFFTDGINKAKSSVDSGIGNIKDVFKGGMDYISGLISPVMDQVRRLGDMAGGLKDKVGGGISSVKGMVPGFADGGWVGGAGMNISRSNGDNRLITARDDEFIANRQQRDNFFEAAMEGKLSGEGDSGGSNNYTINALDSRSFIDMVKRDGSQIVQALKPALQRI